KVLAKGINDLATIIREKAHKHCIPILSAPFLARTLYFHTKIGDTIPTILYKLIAEVLAWVWKIKIWKEHGGVFPERPKTLFMPLNLNFLKKEKNNE
ncbi:MAG TPA: EscU/YscU/HrcU family type III secretion system export apparatus switch protein, partial [Buchnera sp. (in: enterobacteria)]|nr:EscU/YscU/HrcU family type III secretion system export apparatus switch protein [Buchnera sp. (in: enterobacteria)]